jgi:murein DD-endopeptidase MepM/ murein hydrolase activator NlpD
MSSLGRVSTVITRFGACLAIFAMISYGLEAQTPRLTAVPADPAPGSIVRLTVQASPIRNDPVVAVRGWMAGEPLHFFPSADGNWRAIGGVPVDASESIVARVSVERRSRAVEPTSVRLRLPRPPARAPQRVAVAGRFTEPLDAATQARIARENQRAREVGRRAHATPPMWTEPFLRPRTTAITSGFGTGRLFNGRVESRHLGVDFRGATGEPVRAANRGIVALVDTFFLAGTVVYIDHGAGVVTGYLHLSEPLVAVADTVARGQNIALVGATGRVTGPHLHWSARYGVLAVNPLDLLPAEIGTYGDAARRQAGQ